MDYKKIYHLFIEDRKNKVITDKYFEKHHILPRGMGGNDCAENIIKLTAEDHFFAHILLSKFSVNQKHALALMMGNARHMKGRVLRRHIGSARRVLKQSPSAETLKKMIAARNTPEAKLRTSIALKGKKKSEAHKQKISLGLQNMSDENKQKRSQSAKAFHTGRVASDASRKKMSDAQQRRSPEDEKLRREKISQSNSGKVRTAEMRKAYSEAQKKSPSILERTKKARAALPPEMLSKGGKIGGKKVGSLPWWTNGQINKKCVDQPDSTFRRGITHNLKSINN